MGKSDKARAKAVSKAIAAQRNKLDDEEAEMIRAEREEFRRQQPASSAEPGSTNAGDTSPSKKAKIDHDFVETIQDDEVLEDAQHRDEEQEEEANIPATQPFVNTFVPGAEAPAGAAASATPNPNGPPAPFTPPDLSRQYGPLPAGQDGQPVRAVPEAALQPDFSSFQAVLLQLEHIVDAVINVHFQGPGQLRKSQDATGFQMDEIRIGMEKNIVKTESLETKFANLEVLVNDKIKASSTSSASTLAAAPIPPRTEPQSPAAATPPTRAQNPYAWSPHRLGAVRSSSLAGESDSSRTPRTAARPPPQPHYPMPFENRVMVVVGGFTFDTQGAFIEDNTREIQKNMPKTLEKPVDFWAQSEMSTTGITKFGSNEAMSKYPEVYKYKMDPTLEPTFNREKLRMTMHKPASERRHTRSLYILTNILESNIKNPADLDQILACKLRGVIWWRSKRIYMFHYNNCTENWYDGNWLDPGAPLSLDKAKQALANEL